MGLDMRDVKEKRSNRNNIRVSGIGIEWRPDKGVCTFEKLPVAMMWVDTTLAGVMSGVQAMVGTERFLLALQSQGRKSVEEDWKVISAFPDFREGFRAISNIAAVAGWGRWSLLHIDDKKKECRFSVADSWEAPVIAPVALIGGPVSEGVGRVLGQRDAGGENGRLLF